VLNGNYEPLNVCSTQRAIGLMLAGKATVVENGRGVIHTVSRTYERPSVIRLAHTVHRPRPTVRLCKREILRRDNYQCQYCSKKLSQLTVDHVVPRHRGGLHSWENVVAACPQCNRRKGGHTLSEAKMTLLRQPFEPRPTAEYVYGLYISGNGTWARYLRGW
ncbi:MAG: HNH endonuclease, partial [Anaerolineales bacterium]|nr:HNH endonuclease [Anaerolineales bacterium]